MILMGFPMATNVGFDMTTNVRIRMTSSVRPMAPNVHPIVSDVPFFSNLKISWKYMEVAACRLLLAVCYLQFAICCLLFAV